MADIEVVIKIPEALYNNIKKGCGIYPYRLVYEAMRTGTPLLKGHGDLIDRKKLLNSPYEKGGFVNWYDEIKYADTIIPADKEADNTIICPNCGIEQYSDKDYCMDCGARLEESE